MMKVTEFIRYLETERENCTAKAEALTKDERRDEANMQKVRANIFDIFAVVAQTALKRFPQDAPGFIKGKLAAIPAAWEASLAAAEKAKDYEKAAAERIKLQAMAEIREKFDDVLRESQ